jgi:hypothetical protein
MRVHDDDRGRFEELDEQRRRVDEEFALIVQRMREGSVDDLDRIKLEVQHLQVRHQGIIQEMMGLLV